MPVRVDELARSLIEEHGARAVLVAVERLNQSIDERDIQSRDFWAQVVHAIHEHQPLVRGSKQRVSGRSRRANSRST